MGISRLRPVADTTVSDWLVEGVGSFGTDVGSLLPQGFESYVRLLHPAVSVEEGPIQWATVAEWSGGTMHSKVQFAELARTRSGFGLGPAPWEEPPPAGELPTELLSYLCEVLAGYTTTRRRCLFCLWDGYGWIYGSPSVAKVGSLATIPPAFPPEVIDGPRVKLPGRDYILFQGPLDAAQDLGWHLSDDEFIPQSPNVFWPEDHAWCVTTDIDLDSTYIGGSAELARDLLVDARLEVVPVNPTDPISSSSDDAN